MGRCWQVSLMELLYKYIYLIPNLLGKISIPCLKLVFYYFFIIIKFFKWFLYDFKVNDAIWFKIANFFFNSFSDIRNRIHQKQMATECDKFEAQVERFNCMAE